MPVVAMRWTMARKVNTIGKYAAENGNAAALRNSRPRMTLEKALYDYSRSATSSEQKHVMGVVKGSTYKMQLLNLQSTLKPRNAIILLCI